MAAKVVPVGDPRLARRMPHVETESVQQSDYILGAGCELIEISLVVSMPSSLDRKLNISTTMIY